MAESLDKQLAVADVYAAALFELARQAGRVDEVRRELEELVKLEAEEPAFGSLISSAAITTEKRAASLERVFRGRLSDLVLNTLQVMNQHGRSGLHRVLLRCYELRQEHAAGQIEALALTAVELSKTQRRAIEEITADLSGKKPLLRYVVDPDVLGGLVLQIGDWRYDNSLRRHLSVAHARLRERSDRGLKVSGAE